MRLWLIPVALAVCLAADVHQDVLDFFTDLAASLSANDAQQFLAAFDPNMPGYAKLRDGVTGLTRAGDIESSVVVAGDDGDATHRSVEVDWRLRVKNNMTATASMPREQRLECKLEKRGKKWKIVSLDPVGYFAR
jgi:hypothetical protein